MIYYYSFLIILFILFWVLDFLTNKFLNVSFTTSDNAKTNLKSLIGLEFLNSILFSGAIYILFISDSSLLKPFILLFVVIFLLLYYLLKLLLSHIHINANSNTFKFLNHLGQSIYYFPIFWIITLPTYALLKKKADKIFAHNYPSFLTEEQLLKIIEKDSELEEGEKDMLSSIIGFSNIKAAEIMIPRTEVIGINIEDQFDTIVQIIKQKGFSRLPVFRESLDDIVGILYAKDLIGLDKENFNLENLLRKPVFMPETAKLDELLKIVIEKKVQFIIILDEYGGTSGIITLEDIIEEIVGEIEDEYDKHLKEIEKIEKNRFKVKATVEIETLNEQLNLDLPKLEGIETIGGFILYNLEKIPKKGELFEYNNLQFKVLDADERKINWLLLTIKHRA